MSDYISRKAAIDELRKAADCANCNAGAGGICGFCDIDNAARLINGIPAADVEPVRRGRWESYTHSHYCGTDKYGEPAFSDGVVYYCSNPKCRRKTVIKENYCPSCGSKMRKIVNYRHSQRWIWAAISRRI